MQSQSNITIGLYTFDSRYCIGQGSFGKVYKGLNTKTNQLVAIKQIDRTLVTQEQINKQIGILRPLTHQNIVKYEDALKTAQFFYIITQYCNGGDLRNFLEDSDADSDSEDNSKTKVSRLVDMFFQICEGFSYLQKFNIIHRDLKPTNILIHNGIYKIADFGVAKTEQLHKSLVNNEVVGVPIYMSPQILSKNFYSYKCDIWSIGVIMFQYYFEKLPWKATDVNDLFFQIMANPNPYNNQNKAVPILLKYIFENTLQYLQKQRMSWDQLLGLHKNRKKIFGDSSKSKNLDSSKSQSLQKTKSKIQYNLHQPRAHLTVPPYQSEIVSHIISQTMSLIADFTGLLKDQCVSAFLNTCKNYLFLGIQHKQYFVDCGFFLIKIAGEQLHLYMMQLDSLQEARPLLILLQLIHDVITMPTSILQQDYRIRISTSLRESRIDQYAASVISKINTYRFKESRQY